MNNLFHEVGLRPVTYQSNIKNKNRNKLSHVKCVIPCLQSSHALNEGCCKLEACKMIFDSLKSIIKTHPKNQPALNAIGMSHRHTDFVPDFLYTTDTHTHMYILKFLFSNTLSSHIFTGYNLYNLMI